VSSFGGVGYDAARVVAELLAGAVGAVDGPSRAIGDEHERIVVANTVGKPLMFSWDAIDSTRYCMALPQKMDPLRRRCTFDPLQEGQGGGVQFDRTSCLLTESRITRVNARV